jgi:thiol-disulfide isomerase/thioredoxin
MKANSKIIVSAAAGAMIILAGCSSETAAPKSGLPEIAPPTATVVDIVQLKSQLSTPAAQPLRMVHIWATWCGPCVHEFPELVALAEYPPMREVDVLLLSADLPDERAAVVDFLREQSSPWDSLIAENFNEDVINLFPPDWGGAIPATFFYSRTGELLKWWSGAMSREDFERTIAELLESEQ